MTFYFVFAWKTWSWSHVWRSLVSETSSSTPVLKLMFLSEVSIFPSPWRPCGGVLLVESKIITCFLLVCLLWDVFRVFLLVRLSPQQIVWINSIALPDPYFSQVKGVNKGPTQTNLPPSFMLFLWKLCFCLLPSFLLSFLHSYLPSLFSPLYLPPSLPSLITLLDFLPSFPSQLPLLFLSLMFPLFHLLRKSEAYYLYFFNEKVIFKLILLVDFMWVIHTKYLQFITVIL